MAQPDTSKWDGLNRGAGAFSTPGVDPAFVPKDFVPRTAAPQVTFRTKDTEPPSTLYVSQEDSLQIRAFSYLAGQSLLVLLRTLRPDGTVFQTTQQFQLAAVQTLQTFTLNLEEGYLLGLLIAYQATGVAPHTNWLAVNLVRNASVQVLVSGSVTPGAFLGWPGGPMNMPRDGAGFIRSITGTVPAAGAEISETVPANLRWRLLAFRYSLTSAVAVANRETNLTMDDGVNIFVSDTSSTTQAASLTNIYSWMQNAQRQAAAQSALFTLPLPDVYLEGGFRIRTSTTNIQAADQYTAPQYLVQEWFDNQ